MDSGNFTAALLFGIILAIGCVGTAPAANYQQQSFQSYAKAISPCRLMQAESDLAELDNPSIEVMFSYPRSWNSVEWTRYSALRNYYFREADGADLPGHPLVSVSSNAVLVKGPGSYEPDPNPTLEKYLPARLYEIDNSFGVPADEVAACSATLASLPAYKLSYSTVGDADAPGSEWNYAEIFAVGKDGKIYGVFYRAQGSAFENYLPGFEAISKSLRVRS